MGGGVITAATLSIFTTNKCREVDWTACLT